MNDNDPEPLTERTITDPSSARITWVSFHSVGFLLLYLSGNWPSWPEGWPFLALVAYTTLLYVAAGSLDPGYVPAVDSQEEARAATGLKAAASPLLDLPKCTHCRTPQPARFKHCYDCGRCVRRLDHHCWWLGNCVGVHNHRVFLMYLTCQATLICSFGVLVARGAWYTSPTPYGPIPALSGLGAVGCVTMSSVLGLLSVSLLLFQCGLIARGETTWEHLRRERINAAAKLPPDVRPYDRGPMRNCLGFWLGWPSTPSTAAAITPASEAPVDAPSRFGL